MYMVLVKFRDDKVQKDLYIGEHFMQPTACPNFVIPVIPGRLFLIACLFLNLQTQGCQKEPAAAMRRLLGVYASATCIK